MPALTALLLALSVGIFAGTWPWSGDSSGSASVVAATASVAAFGGVLFTLLVLPIQAANQIGAGYMAEQLYRPGVWLVGAWLVLVAATLFALAAIRPDREATIAAGLLAAAALGVVWIAARRLVGSSDPQSLARRQGEFLRRGSRRSRRYVREEMSRSLKKELRGTPAAALVLDDEERAVLNGFLRQFRAGVTGAIAQRQVVAGINLWDATLETFRDFVRETDGAVGESSGVTMTLLDIADQLVMQGMALPADDEAVYTIGSLARLFEEAPSRAEFSVVRGLAISRLRRWVEDAWRNDETRVPAAALEVCGRLLQGFVETGNHEDVGQALRVLSELSARAVADSRLHVSTTGYQEIVKALGVFLSVADDNYRAHYLRLWVREADDLPRLRLIEEKEFFRRGTEAIYPGINLWGVGIQEVLAAAAAKPEVSFDLVAQLGDWVRLSLQVFGARKVGVKYLAQEGLALLYCLALTQAFGVWLTGEARPSEASKITETVLSWVALLPEEELAPVLFDEDIEELLWSVLLASSYVARGPETLAHASGQLLQRVEPLVGTRPIHDTYVIEFLSGLLLAADRPDDQVEQVRDRLLESDDPFRIFVGRGLHIDAIGRVPGVNQNLAAVLDPRLYGIINAWSLDTFPRFRSTS
jgi:hypothetical protein